jgi:hypothetical protein
MNAPLNILAALASYGAKAVIEQGRVRLVCPKDNPPPAELIEVARAHKGELHQLLAQEARRDRFEERAATLEFDEGLSRAEAEAIARREMMAGVCDDTQAARDPGSYASALAVLRAYCPACVPEDRRHQAIADAATFISEWGAQAQAFGWTERELFGLPDVPDRPRPSYQRLSRYDQTGLVWLLHGRRAVELTKDKAIIETANGTVVYRRYNKPALGPLGDSLDDFASGSEGIAEDEAEITTFLDPRAHFGSEV